MAHPTPPPGARYVKPVVSVLYSGDGASLASPYLAFYVGGLLAAADYSDVKLVPLGPRKGQAAPLPKKISPYADALVDEVLQIHLPTLGRVARVSKQWLNHEDGNEADKLATLAKSQLVLVCTHAADVEAAGDLLLKAFEPGKDAKGRSLLRPKKEGVSRPARNEDVAIMSLNYGVSAARDLTGKLDGAINPDVITGAACFEVSHCRTDRALKVLVPGCFVFRRLKREQKHCEKFLDLLGTAAIPVQYAHDPLNHSWGCVAVASSMSVPAALSLHPTVLGALSDWRLRLVAAAVLKETSDALQAAFSLAQKDAKEKRRLAGEQSARRPSRERPWQPSAVAVSRLSFNTLVALLGLPIPDAIFSRVAPWIFPLQSKVTAVAQLDLKARCPSYASQGLGRLMDSVGPAADGMVATRCLVTLFDEAVKGDGPTLSPAEIYDMVLRGNDALRGVQRAGHVLILKSIVGGFFFYAMYLFILSRID